MSHNIAVFCYETSELAFSDEAVRFQLMIASGFPLMSLQFRAGPGASWLRTFNSLHQCEPFAGIAVFVRKGVTLAQMSMAPYGPGSIVTGPLGGLAPPAHALIANWPPTNMTHMLSRQPLTQQMQQQVAQTGTASQLLSAMQLANMDTMQSGI